MPDYPADWSAVAQAVRDVAGWRCVRCGHPHETPGQRQPCDCRCTHCHDGYCRTLGVVPLDGDPANVVDWNLAALCGPCRRHVQITFHPDRVDVFYLIFEPWLRPYMLRRQIALGQVTVEELFGNGD